MILKQPKVWRKVKLGEIADINMGQSPRSEFYNTHGRGLPFYQGVTDFGEKYPKKSIYCSQPTKIAEEGDIFFSVRAPVGDVNVATEKSCIGRGVAALRMKNKNNEFLYFLLKHYEKYFKGIAGGTTYESINKDQIKDIELVVPDNPDDQKRIADILSAFDEKIELNNKISRTLEEIAQAIFKEWFVNFRFPGHEKVKMVDSELGKIPEGWKIGYLGDTKCSEIIKPGIKKFKGEKIYLATADVIGNEVVNHKTKITFEKKPIRANAQPLLNSIWFAKMINTYKVLFFFKGNVEDVDKYILSTGFIGIRALRELQYYFYLLINSEKFHNLKDTLVQGAVQEALANTSLKEIKVVIPLDNIILQFNKQVEPLITRIFNNKKENQKLAALRNLLLPKLMNGEIEIKTDLMELVFSYFDRIYKTTNYDWLVDKEARSRIWNSLQKASKITGLSLSELLARIDFKQNDLRIEALDSFLAELRSIFWLQNLGFSKITPNKAKKKTKYPDFEAQFGGKKCAIEVFCLTEKHGQKPNPVINAYVNFNPQWEGSKFGRDFIAIANRKKKQLDSVDADIKFLLCVVNIEIMTSANRKKDWEKHAEFLYNKLSWGSGYYIGILTGASVNGELTDVIFPKL